MLAGLEKSARERERRERGRRVRGAAGPRAGGQTAAAWRGRGRRAPTWRGPASPRLRGGVTAPAPPRPAGARAPRVLSMRSQRRHVGRLGQGRRRKKGSGGGASAVRRGGRWCRRRQSPEVGKSPAGGWHPRARCSTNPPDRR